MFLSNQVDLFLAVLFLKQRRNKHIMPQDKWENMFMFWEMNVAFLITCRDLGGDEDRGAQHPWSFRSFTSDNLLQSKLWCHQSSAQLWSHRLLRTPPHCLQHPFCEPPAPSNGLWVSLPLMLKLHFCSFCFFLMVGRLPITLWTKASSADAVAQVCSPRHSESWGRRTT